MGGALALDELLGIPLDPGEALRVGYSKDDPALNAVRDVLRQRMTVTGSDDATSVRVGSIRVTLDGSIVTVTDADRDTVVATIDAEIVGIPAAELANDLNRYGFIGARPGGAVISNGVARELAYPSSDDFVDLVAIDGRFVGLTEDPTPRAGSRLVWSSTDGLEWESRGRAVFPSAAGASVSMNQVLRRADGQPGQPLVAAVMIYEAETQRTELWSSADAVTWVVTGLVSTYPGPQTPFLAPSPSGGYLMTGDDFLVHVSATGAEWTAVEGLSGVGAAAFEHGGSSGPEVTRQAAFIFENPLVGGRVLWVLRIEGGS